MRERAHGDDQRVPEGMSGVIRGEDAGSATSQQRNEDRPLTPTSPYWLSTTASPPVVGQRPLSRSNRRESSWHPELLSSGAYKRKPRDEAGSRCVCCVDKQQSRDRFHGS